MAERLIDWWRGDVFDLALTWKALEWLSRRRRVISIGCGSLTLYFWMPSWSRRGSLFCWSWLWICGFKVESQNLDRTGEMLKKKRVRMKLMKDLEIFSSSREVDNWPEPLRNRFAQVITARRMIRLNQELSHRAKMLLRRWSIVELGSKTSRNLSVFRKGRWKARQRWRD